ncbi:hypothetical protein ONZ43_g1773 [Nemania bipapillata]|uniref:Uncharacterized protein n=1 Tax=Nemania bipapillata TaxID=110536 RepID=A0ACC2J343_9PEZI|nr:hypothetical protein ONZ43_g1773 [Nemania bipapillata]
MLLDGALPERVSDHDGVPAMIEAFKSDTDGKKVNLGPGMYCDDDAKTWVLPAVAKARKILLTDPNFNHDVLPQLGYPDFVSVARQITFGDTLDTRTIVSMQTIAGTGANQFFAHFMSDALRPAKVYLADFYCFASSSQGFATGDIDNDGWAIRHFTKCANGKMEFAVAQSFSKNFGLYGERIGALHLVVDNRNIAARVEETLKRIARAEITSPPGFGAKIIATVMQTSALREQWQQDIKTMSSRLQNIRQRLYDELTKRSTPGNWGHFVTDVGISKHLSLGIC